MAFEATSTETLERGKLYLQAQKNGVSYRAIARLKGRKSGYFNTETGDRAKAEKLARRWFSRWKNEAAGTPHHTMADAAKVHAAWFPAKKAKAKAEFISRWPSIASVRGLAQMDVRTVSSKTIADIVTARRAAGIGETTIKKDIYLIQPVLRAARREGWIESIPEMPDVSVDRHPRYPFTRVEWQIIRTQMALDIDRAKTHRDKVEAQYVSDGAYLIVLGLCRPMEWRKWTIHNIELTNDEHGLNVGWRGHRKTGQQTFVIYSRFQRITDILLRRVREAQASRGVIQPSLRDRLFPFATRLFSDKFSDLLDRLDLRHPVGFQEQEMERTSASLRATGICQELLRQRKRNGFADVLEIAKRAGTSVARIENHYAPFEGDINRGASGSQYVSFDVLTDPDAPTGPTYTGEDDY